MGILIQHLILNAHPLEGLFFGSGKAMVVVAVAATVLIGLAVWMWRAEKRLGRMESEWEMKQKATK